MPSRTNLQQSSYDVQQSTSNPTKIVSDVGYPLQVVSYLVHQAACLAYLTRVAAVYMVSRHPSTSTAG